MVEVKMETYDSTPPAIPNRDLIPAEYYTKPGYIARADLMNLYT